MSRSTRVPSREWKRLFAHRAFTFYGQAFQPVKLKRIFMTFRRIRIFIRLDPATPDVQRTRVPDHVPIPDVAPITYRIRKALLRHVPRSLVTGLATGKHVLVTRRLKSDE